MFSRPLSLRLILVVAGAVTTLGIMLLITWSVEQVTTRSLTKQIGQTMEVLADQVQDKIDRTLVERDRDLKGVAELAKRDTVSDASVAEAFAKRELRSNPDFEWLGIIGPDMSIVGSAGDPKLATNALQSPWVREIFSRLPTTAPTYRLLPPLALSNGAVGSAPWHIELATPIHDQEGRLTAAAVAVVNWDWARATKTILSDGKKAFSDTELFILAGDGQVLLGPPNHAASEASTAGFLTAQKEGNGWVVETDLQGTKYVTGFSSAKADRSFGDLDRKRQLVRN